MFSSLQKKGMRIFTINYDFPNITQHNITKQFDTSVLECRYLINRLTENIIMNINANIVHQFL